MGLISDTYSVMNEAEKQLLIPSSYSRIVARELGLQERQLPQLLRGTGLAKAILYPGDISKVDAGQQMRLLDNALQLAGRPEFGLELGRSLQPASHGPMGYLVLSSPDVHSALEAFAHFLPLRLPFSTVEITRDQEWLVCTLGLKITPRLAVKRVLQECFALMLQAVVESVLGRPLRESLIGLQHARPEYHTRYADYFHVPVTFSASQSDFRIPLKLARVANAVEHSDSYAVAQKLCLSLLAKSPTSALSVADQVRRMLLASPLGSLTLDDAAKAMFITKRTLQRRLDREGASYRRITEQLCAELAARHLLDSDMTVEAVSVLLGYYDTAAFRKAFHRWYGQSPRAYRAGGPTGVC